MPYVFSSLDAELDIVVLYACGSYICAATAIFNFI